MVLKFEIKFFESDNNSYECYDENIRSFFAEVFQLNETFVENVVKCGNRIINEDVSITPTVCKINGEFTGNNERIEAYEMLSFITNFCRNRAFDGSLFVVNPTIFDNHCLFSTKLRSISERKLHSFAFGTQVERNNFIPHVQFATKDASFAFVNQCEMRCEMLSAKFEHCKRRLCLDFRENINYRFVLDYSSIDHIILSNLDGVWTIYLVLCQSALLYETQSVEFNDVNYVQFISEADLSDEDVDAEDTKFQYSEPTKLLRKMTPSRAISPVIFAKSNVLRLNCLDYNLQSLYDPSDTWRQTWAIVSNLNRYSKAPVYIGRIEQFCGSLGNVNFPFQPKLPPNVQYALQCLDSTSYQLHDELYFRGKIEKFLEDVEKMCAENAIATEKALFDLFYAKESLAVIDAFRFLEQQFKKRNLETALRFENQNLVVLRRCVVTPSRMLFLPPIPYQNSRVYRSSDRADLFLKVYLKDDNFQPLRETVAIPESAKHCKEFLDQNILIRLNQGIRMTNRLYEYLGTSDLRGSEMVFYARESSERNAQKLRYQIGDFSGLNPSMFICVLEQVFSKPIAYMSHIDNKNVTVDRDIVELNKQTNKSFVFSDGVGKISDELAVDLTSLLDHDRFIPYSAFQITYGGSKGMVTLNRSLPGVRLGIRRSMNKFTSASSAIDVLKVSEPRYLYLNHAFINMLEQLGVDSSAFMIITRHEFKRMTDSFRCSCKALETIKQTSSHKLNYDTLQDCEIDIFGEIFFQKMLEVSVKHAIKMMKSRAEIRVPETFGRMMCGVLDESNTLKRGQVFVKYSNFNDYMKQEVVVGEVLVVKLPCLHPGDVRKLTAVNIPHLNHICDCIVFPQCGSRPHPNKMCGGNLGGDEYAVIWEKRLIFPAQPSASMEYSLKTNDQTLTKVEVSNLLQFHMEFIQKNNDNLISESHLALSDYLPNGVFDDRSLNLAKLHPIAANYSKGGEAVTLESPESPFYPDFMEKIESKPTYKSKRALGKLYRLICLFEETFEFEDFSNGTVPGNEQLLTFPGWEEFEEEAEDLYHRYCNDIIEIQTQFGITDEFHLLSGVYAAYQEILCGENKTCDYTVINILRNDLICKFTNAFSGTINQRHLEEEMRKKKAKASACYLVTRRLNLAKSTPYYGLPWIFSDILREIAASNSKTENCQHVCGLKRDKNSNDVIDLHNKKAVKKQLKKSLKQWMEKSLENVFGLQHYLNTYDDHFKCIVQPFINKVVNFGSLDIALEEVFRLLSAQLKSGEELENILALKALLTLHSFRQNKKFDFDERTVVNKLEEKDTLIICLSLEKNKFREYVKYCEVVFLRKLKDSGVEEVSGEACEHSLFVTAFGKRRCLNSLRSALSGVSFYEDAGNGNFHFN